MQHFILIYLTQQIHILTEKSHEHTTVDMIEHTTGDMIQQIAGYTYIF